MNKVWFVTGAGSGIGAGVAKAVLRAGDLVVATGRNLDKVRAAYGDVPNENLAFVGLDVADEAQTKVAAEAAVERFGRIDVAVNNAGYSILGNFEEMTTADIERQFATNCPRQFRGDDHGSNRKMPSSASLMPTFRVQAKRGC